MHMIPGKPGARVSICKTGMEVYAMAERQLKCQEWFE